MNARPTLTALDALAAEAIALDRAVAQASTAEDRAKLAALRAATQRQLAAELARMNAC